MHNVGAAHNLQPAASASAWPLMASLRDGTVRTLMAAGADGVITFPSLHTALAVLFAAAFWPVPWLRWIAIVLNSLMMVSIPVEGSHYLVDMLSGGAVAAVAWWPPLLGPSRRQAIIAREAELQPEAASAAMR